MNQLNRVIVNTVAQYVKIICVIVLSLLSTSFVLKELGSSDFGLYSLVGSMLGFLSFLNTTIIRSTQRFLSFHMGRDNATYQKIVYFNSTLLNFIISIGTVAIIVSIEPLLFNGFLEISADKIAEARLLYRMMALSVFFTINVSPINAVFVSHENIVFTSIMGVGISAARLAAAVLLVLFTENKLLWYGFFMLITSVVDYLIYLFVSRKNYSECRNYISLSNIDKSLIKSILSFSWWNLYGTLCVMGRNQGYAFVINKFLTLTANAAYGIANQVSGQINNLVYSLSNAISPIITRSEGAKNSTRMQRFAEESSKISLLMFSVIAIPIIFELDYILSIWLHEVPEYTKPFVISIVIACICDSYSVGLRTAIQAKGDIRNFTLVAYTIKILSIFLSIILLKLDISGIYLFVPYILTEIIGTIATMVYYCKYTSTSLFNLSKTVIKQTTLPFVAGVTVSYMLWEFLDQGVYRLLLNLSLTPICICICIFLFALSDHEKKIVDNVFENSIRKIIHN